jgi:hypothetical protein
MALLRDRIRPALYNFFGGRMERHFAEYRRKALARAQDQLERPWMVLADGCHPNRATLWLTLAGAALAVAPAALAHGGTRSTGYVSTFSDLEPHVVGVSVNVFGRDNTIRLTNYSGKTVVVLGRLREPYLRFSPDRVEENVRSPTTFLNTSRTVPSAARPGARPRWRRVSYGPTFAWHDHRIVWTGNQPPVVVRRDPHVSHLVFRWRLPATTDGKRFAIAGFLGWAPTPKADAAGTSATMIAAGVGVALLAAAAIGLGARRARRRAP